MRHGTEEKRIVMRPRLLDLFCGAGGAAMGYYRAGFDVVGVDVVYQPRYPFEFHQADAMTFPLQGFDAIHASPPCQAYSKICKGMGIAKRFPDLVGNVRELLQDSGLPYVIENVEGSPLHWPITLCGTMFGLRTNGGLWLRRHRLFETNHGMLSPPCNHPASPSIGVYGNGTNSWHRLRLGRNITVDEQREAMGIGWMTRRELSQSVPPAYTKWIGQRLLELMT